MKNPSPGKAGASCSGKWLFCEHVIDVGGATKQLGLPLDLLFASIGGSPSLERSQT